MSRRCELTGKETRSGNNRPFSLKITKRVFRPNIFVKRVLNPLTGRVEKMKLSAKAIRTLKKWSREVIPNEKEANKEKTVSTTKNRVKKDHLTPKQKKEALEIKNKEDKKAVEIKSDKA